MRKYACKDGDWGLVVIGEFICMARRCNGVWLEADFANGRGKPPRLTPFDDDAVIRDVYRLTGWGADGPTEMWVPPVTPVEVKVGMVVQDVGYYGQTPSDQMAYAPSQNENSMLGSRKLRVHGWSTKHTGVTFVDCIECAERFCKRECFDIRLLRCAITGAPLCLPRETNDA